MLKYTNASADHKTNTDAPGSSPEFTGKPLLKGYLPMKHDSKNKQQGLQKQRKTPFFQHKLTFSRESSIQAPYT